MQGEMLLFEAESKAVRGEGSACLSRYAEIFLFSTLFFVEGSENGRKRESN